MSAMTAAQKTMMRDFNQKFFALMEDYWNPTNADGYWDDLTDASVKLLGQFHSSDAALNSFLSNIVVTFLNSREDFVR